MESGEGKLINLIFYATVIIIFICSKFAFSLSKNEDLIFILKPVSYFVEILTGTNSIYLIEKGYYFTNLDILIDKSCSGFNFWMIAFLLSSMVIIENIPDVVQKILLLFVMFAVSFMFMIFVNSSRILIILRIENLSKFINTNPPDWMHEATGAFVYLFFLILFYAGLNRLAVKFKMNSKS